MKSTLTKSVNPDENGYDTITCIVQYDDRRGNGHNTFSITGRTKICGRQDKSGCIHKEIVKHFPEFAHLIKWHLVSSEGPLYYIENTLYHAKENRPTKAWVHYKDEDHPLIPTACKYCDMGEAEAFLSAFPDKIRIEPDESTAKKADIAAARRCAVWPEATLEQLRDKEQLLARLPVLMADFQKDIEALGFTF